MKMIQLVAISLILISCGKVSDTDRVLIENDSNTLSQRLSPGNQVISYTSVSTKPTHAPNTSEPALTLVASVSPPTHNGNTLQATEVRIQGNRAYIAYNSQGDIFAGAIDIVNISHPQTPELISSMIITDTDINGLTIHGNTLYAAAATSRSEFVSAAILMAIKLKGGLLSTDITEVDIKSYAATDADVAGGYVYVTSGAEQGVISKLDSTSLALIEELPLHDARGVDAGSTSIAIVSGANAGTADPAHLYVFDDNLSNGQVVYDLNGAETPYSKSTVEVKGGVAVLGMGDGGTQLVCLADGSLIDSIAQPVITGLDASVTVTNAVTAFKRTLFIANGEAGVYASRSANVIHNTDCIVGNLNHLGKLAFNDLESVNHVVYRANSLFVAAGTGGLKILYVEDIDTDVTDSDDI